MARQLHFFGDSFTAGDEIADHHYIENYPQYINSWEAIEKSWELQRPSFDHLNAKQLESLLLHEKKISYPGLLGGFNHAYSGASLPSMARDVIKYLEGTDTSAIIFLQPSSINRWCEYIDGNWVDLSPANHGKYEDYYKFKVSHNTDESNLVTWYNTFLTLTSYISTHTKTADWWIINNGTMNEIKNIIEKQSDKMFSKTFEKIMINAYGMNEYGIPIKAAK